MKELKNVEKTQKMTGLVKFYEQNNDPVLKEKDWYKKRIVEMTEQIDNEKFLKRIFISLRDYLQEKQ